MHGVHVENPRINRSVMAPIPALNLRLRYLRLKKRKLHFFALAKPHQIRDFAMVRIRIDELANQH